MRFIVITQLRTATVIAVVEVPEAMSAGAVALAWAKGEGFERFPKDCVYCERPLIPYSKVEDRLRPITD